MKIKNLRGVEWKKDNKAVSPAISTVILTSAIVVLLLVTIVFANNFLSSRMTENEFSAMKQFMQTVALQIDDVAWIPGRVQTIRYASRYGHVKFENDVLNYSVYLHDGTSYKFFANFNTGILLFNVPISSYTVGNNYYERVHPPSGSFLQRGTSASTSHVFVVEKLPMGDGNYIRIVVTPCIRVLNSTLGATKYFRFFLPILVPGDSPRHSQSVTLTGRLVSVKTGTCNAVRITVNFPRESFQKGGFSEDFFRFERITETFNVPSGSIIEFYTARVVVSLGLHS
ncbi:MAG: hypothetical protein NZ932_03130 [Candidatus Bathyarchaeota archaeon]|nr:hypothetical protein [Candidatus Bathyarchaeota archaeon]